MINFFVLTFALESGVGNVGDIVGYLVSFVDTLTFMWCIRKLKGTVTSPMSGAC